MSADNVGITITSILQRYWARYWAKVISAATWVSVGALVVLMVILAIDGILRRFDAPISGAGEIVILALVILVFAGMAYTTKQNGHVGVDFVLHRLQPGSKRVVNSVTKLVCTVLLGLIVWQTLLRALRMWDTDRSTAVLFIPIAPFVLFVALGCLIWFVVVLSDFSRSITERVGTNSSRTWLLPALAGSLTLILGTALVSHWFPWEISPMLTGIAALIILIPALASGMPVGFVLILLGLIGLSVVNGFAVGVIPLGQITYTETARYDMAVVPLFILMGEFVFLSGLGRDLYDATYKWLGHLPGGLASATIAACAGFASICGSSVATASTMTTVALPEMRKRNYDPALATGAIASGGNIGTLIPPSVAFVIYGIIAEQSIGRLFIAGIVPGVLMAALFIGTISIIAHRNPKLAPPGPISSIKEKLLAFKGVWVIILLFILVIGGIYTGIFTVTEIAGVGALGALIIGLALRRFTRQSLARSFRETIVITCMAFLLFMGGRIFGILIATSEIPFIAAEFIMGSGLSTLAILLVILLIFLILGCVMPGWPVMILMVPIIFPAVIALGWDPIWFGVMMVLMSEFGAITPPVGINVYVVAGVARDIPMSTVFRGTIPFLCALTILTVLLIAFPSIALFLPNLMMGP